ncbi:MAG: alkaline phosphatase family protein [Myxococcota bacterium]
MQRPKVVFVVLDAFPFGAVEVGRTPTLCSLAAEGGHAKEGGQAVLSASTYPNHASLVTGRPPSEHRIFTGRSWSEGRFVEARETGPATGTLFDDCHEAGLRAIAATGDQNLIGVCGAQVAEAHWPPGGELPEGTPRGRLGYGADRAVVEAFDALEPGRADFTFVQLDEVDTARHLEGPWNAEVEAQCRATDAALGELLERFGSIWSETVVMVVSDHDHEAVERGAVDLVAHARDRELDLVIDHDGTAALVAGAVDSSLLLEFPGVVGTQVLAEEMTLVWGAPGQQFGTDWQLAAHHGSPRTARQLAVVGGGHPAARQLGDRIRKAPPACTSWAGWVRDLLALV